VRNRLSVTIAASLVLLTGLNAPARGQRSIADARSSIDAAVEAAVARRDVPGVVAMVVDAGGVRYEHASGTADASTGRAMRTDAIFRIASMTKPITSVAAMQLVEQGRLSLDDEAGKYLPELARMPVVVTFDSQTGERTLRPAVRPITIRHLLTHTAGFGYGFTSAVVRDYKPRDGEAAAVSPPIAGGNAPLLFDPGDQWWYGVNTDWLGRIIEKVSGEPLDMYFERHILGPLKMVDTFFVVPADKQARVAAVHRRGADGTFTSSPSTFQAPAAFSGGGGLFSTAADYARFVRMVLGEGALDGARIVQAGTIRTMRVNQIGEVSVRALKTAQPAVSADFTMVNDGRDKWGFGFLISVAPPPGRRSPGSISWAGLDNTWFWIDPAKGIGGLFLSQMLPFADARVLGALDGFEQLVYASTQAN
jgi:CubicO group peptidase (beta-lactamase class C family)